MSGESAMEARLAPCRLRGADLIQSKFAHDLALTLVRNCSSVFAVVKPAAVFSHKLCGACGSCSCVSHHMTSVEREVVRAFAHGLGDQGIRLDVVGVNKGRLQLLVWNEGLVSQVLEDADVREFMVAQGFDASDASALMAQIRRRLCNFHLGISADYPHEIGVILGYPLEDVLGFIHHDREVERGPWRVYGNVENARRCFERMQQSQEAYQRLYEQGMTLGALVRRGQLHARTVPTP